MKTAVVAIMLAASALAGTLTIAVITSERDQRATRLKHRIDALQHQQQRLEALVCVLAHTNSRDDRVVITLYETQGGLRRADYRADYPDC